jgi:hypothetical protein
LFNTCYYPKWISPKSIWSTSQRWFVGTLWDALVGWSIIWQEWFMSATQTWKMIAGLYFSRVDGWKGFGAGGSNFIYSLQVYLEDTSHVSVGQVFSGSRCPILADSLQHLDCVWEVKDSYRVWSYFCLFSFLISRFIFLLESHIFLDLIIFLDTLYGNT